MLFPALFSGVLCRCGDQNCVWHLRDMRTPTKEEYEDAYLHWFCRYCYTNFVTTHTKDLECIQIQFMCITCPPNLVDNKAKTWHWKLPIIEWDKKQQREKKTGKFNIFHLPDMYYRHVYCPVCKDFKIEPREIDYASMIPLSTKELNAILIDKDLTYGAV